MRAEFVTMAVSQVAIAACAVELPQMFPRGQKRILDSVLGVGRVLQTAHGNVMKIRQALGD